MFNVKDLFLKKSFWFFLLIGLLIIAFIILFKGSFLIDDSKRPTIKKYSSSKYGFSINYPDNWGVLNEKGLAKLKNNFVFALVKRNPGALFGIKIQKAKTIDVKIEEIAEVLDKDLPRKFDNFSSIDQEIITLQGDQRALKYSYTFSSKEGTKTWEQLIVILASEKVYHLTAWTSFKENSAIKNDIDLIVSSFKVFN